MVRRQNILGGRAPLAMLSATVNGKLERRRVPQVSAVLPHTPARPLGSRDERRISGKDG